MPHDDQAAVTRLYERLTEALQRTRRDPFNVPVTVAEIYQELVPYRLVRAEIGFDMNADYEHALLRLLAGEGEWVRIEPPQAAEEIRRELHGPNPNLTIYRNYAACDVWVRNPPARTVQQPVDVGVPTRAAPAPAVRPAGQPSVTAAGRAPAVRPLPEQTPAGRATAERKPAASPPAELASATPAQAVRPPAEPPAAERKQPARSAAEPPSVPARQNEDRRPEPASIRQKHTRDVAPEPVADWQVPVELKDITVAGEAPGAALFAKFTRDERSADRGDKKDEERVVAASPMSEKPKREAAVGGDAAAATPPAKPAQAANPTRSAATPAANPAALPTGTPAASPARAAAHTARAGVHAARPEPARCAFCDSALPQQRPARFCPYCGADQTTRPCPSCGEAVEPGWAFCITCGATAQ